MKKKFSFGSLSAALLAGAFLVSFAGLARSAAIILDPLKKEPSLIEEKQEPEEVKDKGRKVGGGSSSAASRKRTKALPSCTVFISLYDKVLLSVSEDGEEVEPTPAEINELNLLAFLMMGYVSGIQDATNSVVTNEGGTVNEWGLLEQAYAYCTDRPDMTFQNAVRALKPIINTVTKMKQEELNRCWEYVHQNKVCEEIMKKEKKKMQQQQSRQFRLL